MTDFVISRVVIACDSVSESASSIEAAAKFAAWWNVALRAVFVQDEALLHLAALPFARHVSLGGAASEAFNEDMILHQFEAHAARLRAALEAAAHAHQIGWSFEVVRGQPSFTTLSVGDQDLLVIEAASRPFAGEFRLDSRLMASALAAHRPILLVRNAGQRKDGVVALVQKSGPSADRTIATALRLAQAGERRLVVLLAAEDVDAAKILQAIRAVSEKVASRSRVERLSPGGAILEQAAVEGSLLVVDADPSVNDVTALKGLLARTRADILFMR